MRSTDRRSHVLLCANSLWNVRNFRRPLIEALASAGYRVTVATPGSEAGAPAWDGPAAWVELPMRSDGTNPVQDGLLLARFAALLRKERPDIYLSFTAKPNIYGAIAARLLAIPAVPNVSGLGTAFITGGLLERLVAGLARFAFRECPVVFFQNPDDRDLFLQRQLVREEQVRLLPGSGVDVERFKPQPQEAAGEGGCRFLFVGRLLGDKGVREFVEAARMVRRERPDCRFQLLGFVGAVNRTAVTQTELDEWIAEGVIEHLGATDDVRPFLAAADAVVLPSYREGLPRSLLEAAAMGKPLIATDVPGNREVVREGENGLLCEVRSAGALATAFRRFLELPAEQRQEMGLRSRRTAVERFSEEQVISAYLEVVRSLAPARR